MTKTTLKALWFGGGGVIATWLAVTPGRPAPAMQVAGVQRSAEASAPRAEDIQAQADRLRERVSAAAIRPITRNPFRFGVPKTASPQSAVRPSLAPAVMPETAVPPVPVMKLEGIAQDNTPDGMVRTAIITAGGQMYLVNEGGTVAGLFQVVAIDAEAVLLRDGAGAELRLSFPAP